MINTIVSNKHRQCLTSNDQAFQLFQQRFQILKGHIFFLSEKNDSYKDASDIPLGLT